MSHAKSGTDRDSIPRPKIAAADLLDIHFGRAICGDLAQAERREWWLTNGLGAYAAGTLADTLTRRYHGLLIAPVDPPLGRRLVLTKADATLVAREGTWPLHSNRWDGDVIEPRGYSNIETFHLDGTIPVWTYAIAGRLIEKRIWLEQGSNTVHVAFRLAPSPDMPGEEPRLAVKLLVNGRDHHGDTDVQGFNPGVELADGVLRVAISERAMLRIRASSGRIEPRREWHWNFDLPIEAERGLSARDHHLCVGEAWLDLESNAWTGITATLDVEIAGGISAALHRRREHERHVLERAASSYPAAAEIPDWVARLALSADAYLIARPLPEKPDGESVIAGYPWFNDWGRDTMIALPGLTLATGRRDAARQILETFTKFVDWGMLPNVSPGAGERADYNTADAALWFIEAWRAYVEVSGDVDTLDRVYSVLAEAVGWHVTGTRYGIGVDPADGLLRCGEPGIQLTWMDAKIGDWVVTPRTGKPVEINALWYNALVAMMEFAEHLGRSQSEYAELTNMTKRGFARFVRPGGALYDVIDGPDGHDSTIRPNQIMAVSLPHSALESAQQAAVVAECRRELLTSYGLRSLSPRHPAFHSNYVGGVYDRDSGYHQGPVWAWLLGHFALAEYRVTGDADIAQARLETIADHLADAGLGHVSEIFDGAAPHRPRGCPAQAWSVACILEAWWRLERARRSSEGFISTDSNARRGGRRQ